MFDIDVGENAVLKARILVIWMSILVNEYGFTKDELILIARSFPRTIIDKSGVQIYLKSPHCIIRIYSTGRLAILGGIDESQAITHLERVTKKLKHKIFWEPINDSFPADIRVNIPLHMFPLGPIYTFIERSDIKFDSSKVQIDQLVAKISLDRHLQLEKIAKHQSLHMRVAEIRGELHVKLPSFDTIKMEGDDKDLGTVYSKNPTAIIYRSGSLLILGYRSKKSIHLAMKFLWQSLNTNVN
ncbi:hypothetical protein BMR1_01G01115 [Babesia microti strain RI]|uniref:Uncharacterized protein n=1 Tax=Babesia microti (strain RI) TaxID=1133968 RepID=I7J868_BABMR|nr:hypothetical protein BMR1_01G01115 [Babesia microti strain RI]CCF72689.1 hypothetical protein BMR1_01G01115 [Babesia microti strain RI]|eukprot:XP_012647298.1 hypothetical protein BMR1_01G01115 [Babesia microti strain RI]